MPEASAIVTRGHRIASGAAHDPRFPEGTITPQLPFFRKAIPGFEAMLGGAVFPATINLRLPGKRIVIAAPEWRVEHACWTTHFPPETFHLSRAALTIAGRRHPAMLYLPDPLTKPEHFQPTDTIEVLAAAIPSIEYGVSAILHYRREAIQLIAD